MSDSERPILNYLICGSKKKRERDQICGCQGGERSPNSAQEERRGVGLWKPERTEWVPLKAENTGALLLGGAAGGQGCETRAS